MKMFIPYENEHIANVELLSTSALQRFLDIAWDGVDSIDSAWDGCEVGCNIPILENRVCGGGGVAAFDWTLPYCAMGIQAGRACCAASCTKMSLTPS